MAKKAATTEISEVKIRQAIWMVKSGKTKKAICEHLGIAYNTKRLDKLLEDFTEKEARIATLKKKRTKTPFTDIEKKDIANDYSNGDPISTIAERLYTNSARIKKIIIEMNVPIRARSKKGQAKVDHVTQDLDIIFKKGDKVFLPSINSNGIIKEVYDEQWLDYYTEPSRRRYVEFPEFVKCKALYGEDFEGDYDRHWMIYCQYDNGDEWKEGAIKEMIKDVETVIERTGREFYTVAVLGDHAHFRKVSREQLFPIKVA
jgi:hypothetical protein